MGRDPRTSLPRPTPVQNNHALEQQKKDTLVQQLILFLQGLVARFRSIDIGRRFDFRKKLRDRIQNLLRISRRRRTERARLLAEFENEKPDGTRATRQDSAKTTESSQSVTPAPEMLFSFKRQKKPSRIQTGAEAKPKRKWPPNPFRPNP